MGLLERHSGEVRCTMIPDTQTSTIDAKVRQAVEPGSTVYTDALASYQKLESEYIHGVIDHAERYVDGLVHTNGAGELSGACSSGA